MTLRIQPRRTASPDPDVQERADALTRFAQQRDRERLASFGIPTSTIRGSFSARFGDMVICDPSGGAFIIRLPAITPTYIGGQITIKNNSASTNAITIEARSGATIDGSATQTITTAWQCPVLVAISTTEWAIVSYL